MPHRPTVIERAFQLAADGGSHSLRELFGKLRAEGYTQMDFTHFEGPSIRAQLLRRCRQARPVA